MDKCVYIAGRVYALDDTGEVVELPPREAVLELLADVVRRYSVGVDVACPVQAERIADGMWEPPHRLAFGCCAADAPAAPALELLDAAG